LRRVKRMTINTINKRKAVDEIERRRERLRVVERFSNLRVENRTVSGASLDDKFSERRFIKLEQITNEQICSMNKSSNTNEDDLRRWGTCAVLIQKSKPFNTQNGKHFSQLTFGNLDKSELSVKLFGDAHKEHYSECKPGLLFALFDCKPYVCAKTKKFSVSIEDATQMVKIGRSPDFAQCKGTRRDGEPCTKAVNLSNCEFCEFHAGGALKALQTDRVALGVGRAKLAGANGKLIIPSQLAAGNSKSNIPQSNGLNRKIDVNNKMASGGINQIGAQFAARINATRVASHFQNPGGGSGDVIKKSDDAIKSSQLPPPPPIYQSKSVFTGAAAGGNVSMKSKLEQKMQQILLEKKEKNNNSNDDGGDSEDEELLVEDAPRDPAMDARVAKVAFAQKRAKALLGNQEIVAQDPNDTKTKSFKNRSLNVDLGTTTAASIGKENMMNNNVGDSKNVSYISRLECENNRLTRELRETREELAKCKAELVRLSSTCSFGTFGMNNNANTTVRDKSKNKTTSSFTDAFKNVLTKEDTTRPSLNSKEAEDEATANVFTTMDHLEKMDDIRTFLENVREQEVDAYHCKHCNKWTSHYPKQSCGNEGLKHPIEKTKAKARWFSCNACNAHMTTLNQLMPLKCTKQCCKGESFTRTGKPVQSEKQIVGTDRLENIADRKLMKARGIEHGFSLIPKTLS
jgi:minichromosome maintenance protein 10